MFSHLLFVPAKDPVARHRKLRRIARLEGLCELTFELSGDHVNHHRLSVMTNCDALCLAHSVKALKQHQEFFVREINHPPRTLALGEPLSRCAVQRTSRTPRRSIRIATPTVAEALDEEADDG